MWDKIRTTIFILEAHIRVVRLNVKERHARSLRKTLPLGA
jgi:hypothetical protein